MLIRVAFFSLVVLVVLGLVGCAVRPEVTYYMSPAPWALPVAQIKACEAHAGLVQQERLGANHRFLLIDPKGVGAFAVPLPVGRQAMEMALDGTADVWRKGEYRRVRWHCLVAADGTVAYSFIRNL